MLLQPKDILERGSEAPLHHPNPLVRQSLQPVDDLVDEAVGGADAIAIILSRGRVALGIPGAGPYALEDVLELIEVLGYLLVDVVQEGGVGAAECGEPLETLVSQPGEVIEGVVVGLLLIQLRDPADGFLPQRTQSAQRKSRSCLTARWFPGFR